MEIFKASEDLWSSLDARGGRGRKVYPFDKMEIGEAFFAPIEDYRTHNGTGKSCFDLYNSITSCAIPHKPKKFAKRTRKDDSGNAIGIDVVRVE